MKQLTFRFVVPLSAPFLVAGAIAACSGNDNTGAPGDAGLDAIPANDAAPPPADDGGVDADAATDGGDAEASETGPSCSAAGLDPAFGDGGVLFLPKFLSPPLLVQPDGKTLGFLQGVQVMQFSRFLPDFTPDVAFNAKLQQEGVNGGSFALQPDGKILLNTGAPDAGPFVATIVRLNADGSLDPSFGTAGFADNTPIPCGAEVLAVLADGSIVGAGVTNGELGVIKWDSTGRLVPAFGSDTPGAVLISGGNLGTGLYGMAAQSDGHIVLAVRTQSSTDGGGAVFASFVIRLTAQGAVDPSFGSGGQITALPGENLTLAVQPDDKILLATEDVATVQADGGTQTMQRFRLARYLPTGSPDTSFGKQGVAEIDAFPIYPDWSQPPFLGLLPGGGYVLGSDYGGGGVSYSFSVAAFASDGSPAPTVGPQGLVGTVPFQQPPVGRALQPDGKLIVLGEAPSGTPQAGQAEIVRVSCL
jgi:uncharacterized delta-60 repeat protein